jgi:hypothetical protein
MPNDALVNRILALVTNATPSETLVLKIAAALIKQIDQDYDITKDSDSRIKIPMKEWDWIPDGFEVWNEIPTPKDWAIPERVAAAERDDWTAPSLKRNRDE